MRTSSFPPDKYITLQGFIHRETEKAVLFEITGINGTPLQSPYKKEWFPLSQTKSLTRAAPVSDDGEIEEDNITVTEWIASQKNLDVVPATYHKSTHTSQPNTKIPLDNYEDDIPF